MKRPNSANYESFCTFTQTSKMAAVNPRMEKVRNLPLLCVETICKFTPTSQLARLYSNAAPLPGAFWSLGLETVLRKRLPLSLGAKRPYHQAEIRVVVFDAAGATVASIKHPEAFRCSPLLEFIESAFLTVRSVVEESNRGAVLQFYVRDGGAVLANLQNVTALSLVVRDAQPQFEPKDLLISSLKHLLPQLESFVMKWSPYTYYSVSRVDEALCDLVRAMPMREMSRLRRLHLPVDGIRCAMEQSNSRSCSTQPGLSELTSLGIWQSNYWFCMCFQSCACRCSAVLADALRFVSTCCRELTVLFVFVSGELKTYLDAFRALTSLKTLGMSLKSWPIIQMNGLTNDGSEVINSVSDLRIISASDDTGDILAKIAICFPNVRAIALEAVDPLELATSLFGERQLFPAIAKLGCFIDCQMVYWFAKPPTPFLANPHLPEAVDLSHIIFKHLADDANLLMGIYVAMQASSIKSLLLRGPVAREALPRLQGHIALSGENAKVSAWKDRDLGDQPGLTGFFGELYPQTDLQIIGLKTSGNLKGERFTIRVIHQLAKVVDIFD